MLQVKPTTSLHSLTISTDARRLAATMSQPINRSAAATHQRWLIALLFLALLVGQTGCSDKIALIPAPYLNQSENGRKVFEAIPSDQRTSEMDILFAADRSITKRTVLGIEFGTGRSGLLTVGNAHVGFEQPISWDRLVHLSTTDDRATRPAMKLISASEFGVVAVPLTEMEVRDGRYVMTHEAREQIDEGRARFQDELTRRLEKSDRKDVYIFVHGFNNTFSDAVFRLAMTWHMAGRPGVAVAYTWPAGKGGITGYAYDRESGEFTVSHLRRFLSVVASCPAVERVHLVAHSRGTDVVISALRELNIETRAKNLRTKEVYKLDDLVLAAPDVDAEVFEQRFAIEDLHLAANRTTVYLSRTDVALAASRWLFGGGNRVGNLRPDDFPPESRAKLSKLKGFYLVNCNVTGFSTSHDYAFVHPAVVSDLILLLRDREPPGASTSRPLHAPFDGVWEVTNDYLKPVKQ